jgi:hypothetical protein
MQFCTTPGEIFKVRRDKSGMGQTSSGNMTRSATRRHLMNVARVKSI